MKYVIFLIVLATIWAYNLLIHPVVNYPHSGLRDIDYGASITEASFLTVLWLLCWLLFFVAIPTVVRRLQK